MSFIRSLKRKMSKLSDKPAVNTNTQDYADKNFNADTRTEDNIRKNPVVNTITESDLTPDEASESLKQMLLHEWHIEKSNPYDVPSLDTVMKADKMSETDRIWYEAYKKYGNRNHTWQYFRTLHYYYESFLYENIKHWNTREEINQDAHKRYDSGTNQEIKATLSPLYYNGDDPILVGYSCINIITKYTDEKHSQIIEDLHNHISSKSKLINHEYSLGPATEEMEIPWVYQSHDNYSVPDPTNWNIVQKYIQESLTMKANTDSHKFKMIEPLIKRRYISQLYPLLNFDNAEFVTYERLNVYHQIIFHDTNLLDMAMNFGLLKPEERLNFAEKILNKSAEKFGTPTFKVKPTKGLYAGLCSTHIKTFELDSKQTLQEFLKTIVHEDPHRIDWFNPSQGLLGNYYIPLTLLYGSLYVSPKDSFRDYEKNPTEACALRLGDAIGSKLYSAIMAYKQSRQK